LAAMDRLTLDWMQLAALIGSLQGLFLAGVIFAQRANRTANRLLGALMVAFSIYLSSSAYYGTDLFPRYPHFFGASYLMPWIFGPLVYLYAVAAGDRAWRFQRWHLLHFAPAAIVFLAFLPWYFASGPEKVALLARLMGGEVPRRMLLLDPTKFLSGVGYSIATFATLRTHRLRIKENYSNVDRVNLRWLLWFAGAAASIWILAIVLNTGELGDRLREEHVSLAIAVLVYGIGYMGLRQPEVFRYQTAEFPIPVREVAGALPLPEPPPSAESSRYVRSGLTEEEAQALERRLREVMERDRPWSDSELTLPELAARLDTSPHKLSEVLNAQVGQTFYDFVNAYRVREVQRRIEAGDAERLKMLALAMDAGFASKSTFNQVFKKHTSQTPSDFRARFFARAG
jgi:AraC-like DNA-binding protein